MIGLFVVVSTAWGLMLGTQLGPPHDTMDDCFTAQSIVMLEMNIQTICVVLKKEKDDE